MVSLRSIHLASALAIALSSWAPFSAGAQTAGPPAQVAISPPRFELTLGPRPTAESFRVLNLGEEAIEINVSVVNWELDEENQVRTVPPTEQSLDQWMVINPLSFVIPPGESQNVRFSIRPRVEPAPGEHRAMVYLDQVLAEEHATGVRMRFRYGVAVYGHVGPITRVGLLHDVRVVTHPSSMIISFDISNEGTAHVRMSGQFVVWRANEYPGSQAIITLPDVHRGALPPGVVTAGDLPALPVLPDTRRQLTVQQPTDLRPGEYILDLDGDLGGEPIRVSVPFSVASPVVTPST